MLAVKLITMVANRPHTAPSRAEPQRMRTGGRARFIVPNLEESCDTPIAPGRECRRKDIRPAIFKGRAPANQQGRFLPCLFQ